MIRVEEEVKDNVLTIRAELPGIDPEKDVEISVSEGQLHIRGERREESEQKEKGNYRSEFRYGSFYRSVPLPKGIKDGDITATYKDGVLEVKAPVPQPAAEAEPQKIQVTRG